MPVKKSVKSNVGSKKNEHRFTSTLERSTNKLWGSHVPVPRKIADTFTDSRRIVCSLNDQTEYQTALLPYKKGETVIRVNKSLREKLKLEFGDEVVVVIRSDTSEYGLPLPEELRELFRQDKEGSRHFHSLTRGKQRTLLYIVASVKNSDKRIHRAIVVVNHLKTNNGTIDYKQLYIELKQARR